MKILIASDSYKGSLSTLAVADKIKEGIQRVYPEAEIKCASIADGGEGTVEAIISGMGGTMKESTVTGPMGNKVCASYGILSDGKAIIEMAAASGLPLVGETQKDVMKATTYGTGELIRDAMDQGCNEIYIGIGGSATNDGGIGMAQALGFSFLDENDREVSFGGGELSKICKIDISKRDGRLKDTRIAVMSDVTNPLCGPSGAAAVYGPQKGASEKQVQILDEGLKHLAEKIKEVLNIDILELAGTGAAGGLGGGLTAFTDGKISSGIEAILEMTNFEEKVKWADLIITGEGRIDFQSAYGKVISGIAAMASSHEVPVAAIAGSISDGASEVFRCGIDCMESAVCRPMSLAEAMGNSAGDRVADAAERLMRTIKMANKMIK